jgi:hypothetical protein
MALLPPPTQAMTWSACFPRLSICFLASVPITDWKSFTIEG